MTAPHSETGRGRVSVAPEPAGSPDARRCLAAYFAELAERFEGGFDADAALAAVEDEFGPPRGVFLVARLDSEPVGCGGLAAIDAGTAEIKRVWTSASARGFGIARAVLGALEAEARSRGFQRLRLDTNKALAEAQAMYVKAGFRDIDRYNDNPYAHRWFEKRI